MRAYRLDAGDVVRTVTGDWDGFAQGNGGQGAKAAAVVGRVLWDMTQGAATNAFLHRMFYDCRRTQTALGLLYRCDSLLDERLFHMRVMPHGAGGVEVSHHLIRSRPLQVVPLRELGHLRYRKCSQCLSCNFGGPWVAAGHFVLPEGAVAVDAVCPECQAAIFVATGAASQRRPSLCA